MNKSTSSLALLLDELTLAARQRAWTDTEWSARAAVRKETLSRLRSRSSCDFATLSALAGAVGARLTVTRGDAPQPSDDGHFPLHVERAYEGRLLELCAKRPVVAGDWAGAGPRFFMAGLAVLVASVANADRRALLAVAEHLHPGASEPAVFSHWLARSPVRPSRFLPMLAISAKHAA